MGNRGGGNNAASAYPQRSSSSFVMFRIISLIFTFSIIRNMMTKDYRTGEIDYLRKSGFNEEQISKYIPQTQTEVYDKRKKSRTEYEQMKIDLLVLQKQMIEIRKHVGIEDETTDTTTTTDAADGKKKDITSDTASLKNDDGKKSKGDDLTTKDSNTILTKSLSKSLNDEKEKKKIDEKV